MTSTAGRGIAAEIGKRIIRTYGVFGEVYFKFSDNLKLTGGLRYSNDKKYIRARQPFLNVLVPFGTSDVNALLLNFDGDSSTPGQQTFAEQRGTFDAVTGAYLYRQKGYALVNASVTWHSPDEMFEVSLYGRNLFDQQYIGTINSAGTGNSGDRQTLLVGAPQQAFVTLKAGF